MHEHCIAHLDISLRNLLTDYRGHYAYIDYEHSRRLDGINSPRIFNFKATEVPPECEEGECFEPYKVDVWALAVLILRACKAWRLRTVSLDTNANGGDHQLTGYCIPQLILLVKPMLHEDPCQRPPIHDVLIAFDRMVPGVLTPDTSCPTSKYMLNCSSSIDYSPKLSP